MNVTNLACWLLENDSVPITIDTEEADELFMLDEGISSIKTDVLDESNKNTILHIARQLALRLEKGGLKWPFNGRTGSHFNSLNSMILLSKDFESPAWILKKTLGDQVNQVIGEPTILLNWSDTHCSDPTLSAVEVFNLEQIPNETFVVPTLNSKADSINKKVIPKALGVAGSKEYLSYKIATEIYLCLRNEQDNFKSTIFWNNQLWNMFCEQVNTNQKFFFDVAKNLNYILRG